MEDIKIDSDFKKAVKHNLSLLEGGLLGVNNLKCYILVANSSNLDSPIGEDGVRLKERVGYVMVGLNTRVCIPIARDDEHYRGYDLLHILLENDLIPKDTYIPIFSLGLDYIYEESIDQHLQAFKIWHELGGPDITLEAWASHDSDKTLQTISKTFVKNGKMSRLRKNTVSEKGREFIQCLVDLGKLGEKSRSEVDPKLKPYIKKLRDLDRIMDQGYLRIMKSDYIEQSLVVIENDSLSDADKIQQIEELIFGMKSLKKDIHDELKIYSEEEGGNSHTRRDLVKVFGDISKAYLLLGKI